MSDLPYIKFYPSDFLGGVSGLSPAERGVYITILCLIWDHNGPVKIDEGRLARRCGMPKAAFRKALASLMDEGKIHLTDDGLMNGRAKKALSDRENRTKSAKHAANERWSAQKKKSEKNQQEGDASASDAQCADPCAADAIPEARSQIYDGGGSARARDPDPPPKTEARSQLERFIIAAGGEPGHITPSGKMLGTMADRLLADQWLADPPDGLGLTEEVVMEVLRTVSEAKRDGPPHSFNYFTAAMQRRAGEIAAAARPLNPIMPEESKNGPDRSRQSPRSGRPTGAADRARQSLAAGFAGALADER
jgi:uncharacterized protein YdaU (DUF1376 family)